MSLGLIASVAVNSKAARPLSCTTNDCSSLSPPLPRSPRASMASIAHVDGTVARGPAFVLSGTREPLTVLPSVALRRVIPERTLPNEANAITLQERPNEGTSKP